METVLKSRFIEIGSEMDELIKGGVFIFFGENVPSSLKPYCIIHQVEVIHPLKIGDIIQIGKDSAIITSIGELANKNLLELYHLVIKNNGLSKPQLPGDINVKGTLPNEVSIGETMLILRKKNKTAL